MKYIYCLVFSLYLLSFAQNPVQTDFVFWAAADFSPLKDSVNASYRMTATLEDNRYAHFDVFFWPSGNKRATYTVNWEEKTGTLNSWHANGQPFETRTAFFPPHNNNSFLWLCQEVRDSTGNQLVSGGNGTFTCWHQGNNAGKAAECRVEAGKMQGEYREWYPNGTLRFQTTIEDSKATDNIQGWYADGTPRYKVSAGENDSRTGEAWDTAGKRFANTDTAFLLMENVYWERYLLQTDPHPLNLMAIKATVGYPQLAIDAGIQGAVVLRILVDEEGKYRKHKIIRQAHPILSQACEARVSGLEFSPAWIGGYPVKFWVNVPFQFSLNKEPMTLAQKGCLWGGLTGVIGGGIIALITVLKK